MDYAVFHVPANTVQVIQKTVITGQKTQPTVKHFQQEKSFTLESTLKQACYSPSTCHCMTSHILKLIQLILLLCRVSSNGHIPWTISLMLNVASPAPLLPVHE